MVGFLDFNRKPDDDTGQCGPRGPRGPCPGRKSRLTLTALSMRTILDFLRRNKIFVAVVTLAALALRLFFVFRFPHVAGDPFIYGDIPKTWPHHAVYESTENPLARPPLAPLPAL